MPWRTYESIQTSSKVDDLMDEIKEEMEAANEISNALAQPVDPLLHDEDDLLAELEQMSAEAALGAPVVKEQAFPTVPNEKLPAIANASKKEAEESAMLEKELAGKRKGFVVVRFLRWSIVSYSDGSQPGRIGREPRRGVGRGEECREGDTDDDEDGGDGRCRDIRRAAGRWRRSLRGLARLISTAVSLHNFSNPLSNNAIHVSLPTIYVSVYSTSPLSSPRAVS